MFLHSPAYVYLVKVPNFLFASLWQLGRGKYNAATPKENLSGERLSHKSFTNKLREIWAIYPLHPQQIASSYTRNVSIFFGGSECVNGAILSK